MVKKVLNIRIIFLIGFLFILVLLTLNSTTWFRLKLVRFYQGRKDEKKAALIYKKILRKELARYGLTHFVRNAIFPQLRANYSARTKAHFQNAKYYLRTNDFIKAQEEYQKVLDLDEEWKKLHNTYSLPLYSGGKIRNILIESCFNLGKIVFANNELNPYPYMNRVVEMDPGYQDNHTIAWDSFDKNKRFGLFLLNIGLAQAAIQQLQPFSIESPRDTSIHYYLAQLFSEEDEWDKAIEEFQKFILLVNNVKSIPVDKRIQKGLAYSYYQLGLDLEVRGNLDNAIEYYQKALIKDEQIIDCYYRLKNIYEMRNQAEKANTIIRKLLRLKPTYARHYKLNNELTLLGYSLNELDLEVRQSFPITFFWEISNQNSELKHERLNTGDIYKINNRLYQVKMVKNLAPNAGFTISPRGKGFPYGWNSDIYNTTSENHEVVFDMTPFGRSYCLMLNNDRTRYTNCQTDYLAVDNDCLYLQAGWIKTVDGNAYFGRKWYDSNQFSIRYDYVSGKIHSPHWKYYAKVFSLNSRAGYCRLWLINYKTQGKAYFDDILFVKLKPPNIEYDI